MKKISLNKLLGTALFLVLALDASHPALASKIDMSKLSSSEKGEVVKLRQQGKGDEEILKILEERKNSDMDSLRKSFSDLNLGSNTQDLEKIKKLEEEKLSLAESVKRQEEEKKVLAESVKRQEEASKHHEEVTKSLQQTLEKQKEQHATQLKEIEARHTRLLQNEQKRISELEKEIAQAEEAKEFKGIDYINQRLKDVEDRLGSLKEIAEPDDIGIQTFIKQGESDLQNLSTAVQKLDGNMPEDELMGWQKKISIFAFNFEIKALQFISKDISKKGGQLPDNLLSLSIEEQKEMLKKFKESIAAEIKKKKEAEEAQKKREALLRTKLKTIAEEEYKTLSKELEGTSYLLSQRKKTVGTNALKGDMDKLQKYAEATDYDTAQYQELETFEKDIAGDKKIADAKNGDEGSLTKSIRTKIDNLHKAQHPENTTEAQRKFASDLYYILPGKAKVFPRGTSGGPPPPPLGNNSGAKNSSQPVQKSGGNAPPPPPSMGGSNVKEIPEGENFPALYASRLDGYSRNVPSILGLVNEDPKEVANYIKVVLKNAKNKIEMLDGIIKNAEIAKDIQAIMDGNLNEEKAYGYYLLLSTLKPATKADEDISFSWQRSVPATMKAMKSLINYVKTTTLPTEIKKGESFGSKEELNEKKPKDVKNANFFAYIDDDFKDLWRVDPDLSLITFRKEDKDTEANISTLEQAMGGLPKISLLISTFCKTVYGSTPSIKTLTETIGEIQTTVEETPQQRIKKFKETLAKILGDLVVDGHPLSALKGEQPKAIQEYVQPTVLQAGDFHAAILLMSHFLDDDSYLKSLHDLEIQLEKGIIASPDALKLSLHDVIKKNLLAIVQGKPAVMESYKKQDAKTSAHRLVSVKGDILFTPKEVAATFESLDKELQGFAESLKIAYTNYTTGKTIIPPNIQLLTIKNANVRNVLGNYFKIKLEIDEGFITAFMNGFDQVAVKMNENKQYVATVDKVKREYPLYVSPAKGETQDVTLQRQTALRKLVEDAFDFMQILNINKFIPPEDQASNVPYSYVKMMLMFKAFISGQWSNAEKKEPSKGSSVGGSGQGSDLLKDVKLDTLNYQKLEDLYNKVKEASQKHLESLGIKADVSKDATYQGYVADEKKINNQIERLRVLSSFEYWDKHTPQKILVIALDGPKNHAIKPQEKQEILDFMKEIKRDSKAKRTYDSNMKKLEKYQPEIHKEVLALH